MTRRYRHLFPLLGACGLLALSGCGSDEDTGPGFPPELVRSLSNELDLVQERLDVARERNSVGSCNDIEGKSFPEIERLVAQVPEDTDADLRDALDESIARLQELTESECADVQPAETDTTPAEPAPEPTTTEETTPETDTTPTETTPEEKPKKDKQNGKDNGNGDGSGGTSPGQGGGVPAPQVPGSDG